MKKNLILYYCIFFSLIVQGQQPVSIHLSEKDGLPDKEFYTITEDSKGFIWLCADKGLFRFDGKNYKSYSHKAQRGLSLFNAQEDHLGRIWCNNISGQFFYTQNKNLELFIDLSEKLKGELVDFIVDKNNLWALGLREIIKVNLKTKAITSTFRVNDRILGVPAILNNKIYVANSETVYAVSKAEEVEKEFEINLPFKNKNGKNIPVEKAMLFQMDTLLIYNQRRFDKNEFYYLNPDLNAVTKVSDFKAFADQRIFTKLIKENEIWFGTTSGVWVYKKTNVGFVLKKRFFENRNITKIIEDAAANYWFATLNNGIYVIPNIDVEIANIPEHHNNITSLETLNDSTLLFGSVRGNVGIHNIKNNKTRIVNLPTNDRVSVIKFHRKNNLAYISKDVSGYVLNPLSLKVDRVSKIITAKSLTPLNDGTLLFTTNNNIGLLYGTSFESYINQKQTKNKRTYASHFKAKANKVFVAYIDNLVVYDSLWRQKTIRYKNQSIFGKSITETVDGTLWVSTFKNGVFGIKNDVIVKHYTTENGLTSNRIEMVEGDQNKLWIALDNSIQLLDVASNTFEMFTKSDGVLSYAISGVEPLESKVYFSSNEGVFSINKQRVTKNKAPKVYINAVEVNEKEQSITSNYKLKHDENTIKISYNVNGFQFNQKGKYAYRLLGLNDSWVTSETGVNSVKYNSLPSGNYTFEVKPILDNNTKEAKVETLDFSISKPFWKTWWFILSTSIFIFGTTILYFRNKIKKKESQNKKQLKKLALDNELIALKLENLRSQMNPHFIFNALNSIQEYIVLNQKKLASDYLGKFADLIRTYLNHSAKGKITLQEEIDCLEMYLELEKLRFEEKLRYTITTFGRLKPDDIDIPTMLIQPYVENALKHGLLHRKTNRVLEVSFFINHDTNLVKCIIVDNGVGREKAEKFKARSHKTHQSFATKATEDRLTLLNYGKEKQIGVTITDLYNEDMPTGTQVNITIPYTNH